MNQEKWFHKVAIIALATVLLCTTQLLNAQTSINKLRVQDSDQPNAIEDAHPLFSWQMTSSEKGQAQAAYQLIVTRESDNKIVWNSGKVESGLSNNIKYLGVALQPEMDYSWEVTVWDTKGQTYKDKSRFETGIMNPRLYAWEGAEWIGSKELSLDAASTMLFEINTDFKITKGDAASIVFGANDFRMNNQFQNIENVEGENYIRFEFDLSGVGTDKGAVLNVYRVGYGKGDTPTKPYYTISSEKFPETNINDLFTSANKNTVHNIAITVEASSITVKIDGKDLMTSKPAAAPQQGRSGGSGFAVGNTGGFGRNRGSARISISNYSTGNNFNTFPNLCNIGFASEPGDVVEYSNYVVKNLGQADETNKVVFNSETTKNYSAFNNIAGVTTNGRTITVTNTGSKTSVGYIDPSYGANTMLRSTFTTDSEKTIEKAKLYVTSMGSNEMFINGSKVGDAWFAPGDAQFRETLCYYAYDVTKMLNKGNNAIGATLNSGWFTGYMTFTPSNFNFFGDFEALLAKLVITYDDGTEQIVVSNDDTWLSFKDGPVRYGSFFQGERYDANKEAGINNWSTPQYNSSAWKKADIIRQRDWVNFDIVARYDQPVKVRETLTAQKVEPTVSIDKHSYIYNMGVNMVGVPSITIPAGSLKKGDVVIFRYGELLYPGFKGDDNYYEKTYGKRGKNIAGRLLFETYRAALATDFYIAKGSEEVTIQPSTTFRGYQYIQITIPNRTEALPLQNVKGLVLSSDELPTGTYEATTSDGKTGILINQLFKNIQRSQLGNFFTIPTDCPQRNERMGWTGDAQAYTRTGTYNSDAQNFFRQWMVALRADQGIGSKTEAPGGIGSTVPTFNKTDDPSFANGTTWAAAVCMVPWQLYIQYGNKQIIEENIETMMNWLNGMDFYDFNEQYTYLSGKAGGLADWLAMDNRTPSELVNNAIYIYMMEVTAIMADAIGETEYATILRSRHEKAKAEWNEVYVDPVTGKTRNLNGDLVHSQASYATPLNFNTFNEANKVKAEAYLAELAANPSASGNGENKYPAYTITTGFSGTPNILPALSRAGRTEEAFKMISCTDYTSWLYPVTKGATSIWERWNGYEAAFGENTQNNMNSFNHFALGALGQWMYEYQLGITVNHANGVAGYKNFVLQPSVGGTFTSLKGSYDSNYGPISSSWTADGKGVMTSYSAIVPANTTATLYLPVNNNIDNFGTANGVTFVKKTTRNNITVAEYRLASGSYEFAISTNAVTVK